MNGGDLAVAFIFAVTFLGGVSQPCHVSVQQKRHLRRELGSVVRQEVQLPSPPVFGVESERRGMAVCDVQIRLVLRAGQAAS